MGSRADMVHDLGDNLAEMSWREKLTTWFTFYWRPTRRWMPSVAMWWDYKVLRYPEPPPLSRDRIAQHFGFGEHQPCTDGPVCAAHGWDLSPLVRDRGSNDGR